MTDLKHARPLGPEATPFVSTVLRQSARARHAPCACRVVTAGPKPQSSPTCAFSVGPDRTEAPRLPPSSPVSIVTTSLIGAQAGSGARGTSSAPFGETLMCHHAAGLNDVQPNRKGTDHDPHTPPRPSSPPPPPCRGPVIGTEEPPIADVRPCGDGGKWVVPAIVGIISYCAIIAAGAGRWA